MIDAKKCDFCGEVGRHKWFFPSDELSRVLVACEICRMEPQELEGLMRLAAFPIRHRNVPFREYKSLAVRLSRLKYEGFADELDGRFFITDRGRDVLARLIARTNYVFVTPETAQAR